MISLKQILQEISHKEFNLQHEYDRLNHELFSGKLIKIPLKWITSNRHGGYVDGIYNKNTGYRINYLAMNKLYERDYDSFINLLIHEMIHVYIMQNNLQEVGGMHGLVFKHEVDRIKSRGYNVPLSDDITNIKVASDIKLKPLIALILNYVKGNHSIIVIQNNINTSTTETKELFDRADKTLIKSVQLIQSSNSELLKFPKQRNFVYKPKLYTLQENIYKNIFDDVTTVIIKELH